MTNFLLDPIDAATAARLLGDGGVRYIADSKPGYPCRRCLRDAEVGEALILVAFDPFDQDVDSAYRSSSPIFLHERSCQPPQDLTELPDQLTVRQLSVRAFDDAAMMIEADVIDGSDLEGALSALLADHRTDQIHVHNASRGCWAVTVRRPS